MIIGQLLHIQLIQAGRHGTVVTILTLLFHLVLFLVIVLMILPSFTSQPLSIILKPDGTIKIKVCANADSGTIVVISLHATPMGVGAPPLDVYQVVVAKLQIAVPITMIMELFLLVVGQHQLILQAELWLALMILILLVDNTVYKLRL